jgi:hypothetical protein
MDLPVIGSHCTLSTCHDLDLLPVTCTSCTKLFCRFHVSRDAHACPVNLNNNVHPASSHKLARCALEPCSKPSLEAFLGSAANQTDRSPAICIRCRRAFCARQVGRCQISLDCLTCPLISHRYPESHSCPSPEPDEAVGNTAARQLLERHFPSTSSAPKTARVARATTDPKKIAQLRKVELITLRHRAVPADPKDNHKSTPIPLDQRLHVKVQFDTVRPTLERSFWLRKVILVL